jgi:DNA-binding Lrp family transcriptional regulator
VSTKAYILIETAVGKTGDVTRSLNSLNDVVTVDAVTGPYDIIAIVSSDNLTSVGDLVTGKIHIISGIVRTVTCLSVSGI